MLHRDGQRNNWRMRTKCFCLLTFDLRLHKRETFHDTRRHTLTKPMDFFTRYASIVGPYLVFKLKSVKWSSCFEVELLWSENYRALISVINFERQSKPDILSSSKWTLIAEDGMKPGKYMGIPLSIKINQIKTILFQTPVVLTIVYTQKFSFIH